jgi:hypothetical protein
MNQVIFIHQVIIPVKFANELVGFLFAKNDELEITLYSKIEISDRKFLKGVIKKSFIGENVFKRYNLFLDFEQFEKIRNRVERYFENDWGFIIDKNHKGFFSYKNRIFRIDCVDDNDKIEKEQFLNSLIKIGVIDNFEIVEDDYVDPYYQNK